MFSYLFAFFKTRHHTTKHLLTKQKQIRELGIKIESLKEENRKLLGAFSLIHKTVKENTDVPYWY